VNSRERILAAINHKEPDKVPIDLGGTIASTITHVANEKLKKYLKINKSGEIVTQPWLEVVLPLDEILDLFETDCRTIRMKSPTPDPGSSQEVAGYSGDLRDKPQGYTFLDEMGTTWIKGEYDCSPVGGYPLINASLEDLEKHPWPDPYNPGRVEGLKQEARELHEKTDYAILSDIMCGGPFENSLWLRGFEQFLSDLAYDNKFAHTILEKVTDIDIGLWDAQLSQVGEYVDVVCQGDDMGMQSGLQFSPETYRKIIKPYHKKLFSFIRSKTDAKIWLHSCGSVYDIIPDLIEIGIDALNPVQVSAKNMDLKKLKKEYGKDICFWGGGFDVQKIPFMKLDEIKEEVKKVFDIMKPGGGFVFSGSHNVLPETKGETTYNIFMTAKKYRSY
jgi:uroporphyrinogen decarboxylase